jgi:uncharacterized protein (TIGR02453 family)
MSATVPKSSLEFLKRLAKNNTKDWMDENRKEYKVNEKALKEFYAQIGKGLSRTDEIAKVKVFRINRDIRFSKDKTPYNVHRSASFSRAGAQRRGSYYLRIEPGNKSRLGGGFFGPEAADLFRIRKEFEIDASEIRTILSQPEFKNVFGGQFENWNSVKTAPKGFSKEHPNIDLIRLKNFVVTHTFTDKEVIAPNFAQEVVGHFELLQPFFNYMSMVLTTDLNGVSTIS